MFHDSSPVTCAENEKASIFNSYTFTPILLSIPMMQSSIIITLHFSPALYTVTDEDVLELRSSNTSKAMAFLQLFKPLYYLFYLTLKYGYSSSEWELHKMWPNFGKWILITHSYSITFHTTTWTVLCFLNFAWTSELKLSKTLKNTLEIQLHYIKCP